MSDEIPLSCFIWGSSPLDEGIFPIEILRSKSVGVLKAEIWKCNQLTFQRVEARTLVLWKVDPPISANQLETSLASARSPDEVPGAKRLSSSLDLLSAHFSPGGIDSVRIIVKPPSTGQKHGLSDISYDEGKGKQQRRDAVFAVFAALTPRSETVARLYAQLNRDRYVQVRGTPASGKSSLAELLFHHIKDVEPNTTIVPIIGWPKETDQGSDQWLRNAHGWDFEQGAVLMVDEAQGSYWDKRFWNIMKSLGSETSPRVITFVSYGSAYSVYGESPGISPASTVSLRPVAKGSAALLLTKKEFDEFVPVRFPNHRFDESLLDSIFDLTTGHVGACVDLLEFTRSHPSYHSMHGEADSKYTDEHFATLIPISHLVKSAQHMTGVSWRGLPQAHELQVKEKADVFQQVLRDGQISVAESDTPSEPLLHCVRSGWLHNKRTPDTAGMSEFVFASTWHERYVECILSGIEGRIDECSVVTFAVNIILKFSPLNLVPRLIGKAKQSILEAQFQDEFYRTSVVHTNGGVMSFPEFGNRRGRIDFFIPSKKWGIELLRNGDRINKHAKRFTEGEYSRWISRGILEDYVILDFRTSIPRGHDVDKLYYVISEDSWATATIRDHEKKIVRNSFPLLDMYTKCKVVM